MHSLKLLFASEGGEWKFVLSANDLERHSYGIYDSSLHVLVTKQFSREACILDWSITLEIASDDSQELKPICPFTKLVPTPWQQVPTVYEGIPPFR